ncbi:hypothetical protein CI109_101938 [Kwoniella shandongensis]|uniref:Uncharacterized protein n=1 Tax=Kwoniella shandongensis TaxID=1734106 RepID=A0A5M6BTV0_9TREE|nr:uncharacterized protein CI109_005402 [Kwoniella shandongensis]KAA5526278.1 hypothetical protein CI109_005402 [Kwoniella shandongensis]
MSAAAIINHPDSDIIPSILYTPTTTLTASRGRTYSRTFEYIEQRAAEKKLNRSKRDGSSSSTASSSSSSSSSSRKERVAAPGPIQRSPPPRRSTSSRRSSQSSTATAVTKPIDSHQVSAHHSLPETTDEISTDPILFLPPLLSPLPNDQHHHHAHEHGEHGHGHEQQLVLQGLIDALKGFETRLPNIDPASLALHQALHHFRPIGTDYASTRYDEAFNWDQLTLPKAVQREWYCVVFRSRRKPESSNLSLYKADREAHEEAVKNGGLVMYWYGVPDETGLNLATCIWQSRRHAINAISGPKHMSAMKQTEGAYETYSLERWILSKEAGKRDLDLRKWTGGDVGW